MAGTAARAKGERLMDKREQCVIEAARRVAAKCRENEDGFIVAPSDYLLALRFAVRALEGGEGRRLRDFGDECDGRCCPDHRYSEG